MYSLCFLNLRKQTIKIVNMVMLSNFGEKTQFNLLAKKSVTACNASSALSRSPAPQEKFA